MLALDWSQRSLGPCRCSCSHSCEKGLISAIVNTHNVTCCCWMVCIVNDCRVTLVTIALQSHWSYTAQLEQQLLSHKGLCDLFVEFVCLDSTLGVLLAVCVSVHYSVCVCVYVWVCARARLWMCQCVRA